MVIDIECCGVNLVFKSTPSFLIMQQEEGLLEVEEFGQASYLDNDHKDTVVERSPKGRFVRVSLLLNSLTTRSDILSLRPCIAPTTPTLAARSAGTPSR